MRGGAPQPGECCSFLIPLSNPSSPLPGSSQTTRRPLSPPWRPPTAPTTPSLPPNWNLLFRSLPCPQRSRPGQAPEVRAAPASPRVLEPRVPEHRRQEPARVPWPHLGRPRASTRPEISCSPLTGSDRHVPKVLCLLLLSEVRQACPFIRPLGLRLIRLPKCVSGWPGGHSESRDSEGGVLGDGVLASGRLSIAQSWRPRERRPLPGLRVSDPGLAATPTGAHGGGLNPAFLPLQGLWAGHLPALLPGMGLTDLSQPPCPGSRVPFPVSLQGQGGYMRDGDRHQETARCSSSAPRWDQHPRRASMMDSKVCPPFDL